MAEPNHHRLDIPATMADEDSVTKLPSEASNDQTKQDGVDEDKLPARIRTTEDESSETKINERSSTSTIVSNSTTNNNNAITSAAHLQTMMSSIPRDQAQFIQHMMQSLYNQACGQGNNQAMGNNAVLSQAPDQATIFQQMLSNFQARGQGTQDFNGGFLLGGGLNQGLFKGSNGGCLRGEDLNQGIGEGNGQVVVDPLDNATNQGLVEGSNTFKNTQNSIEQNDGTRQPASTDLHTSTQGQGQSVSNPAPVSDVKVGTCSSSLKTPHQQRVLQLALQPPPTNGSNTLSQLKAKNLDYRSAAKDEGPIKDLLGGQYFSELNLLPRDDISSTITDNSGRSVVDVPHNLLPIRSRPTENKQSVIKDNIIDRAYHLAPDILNTSFDPSTDKKMRPEFQERLKSMHCNVIEETEELMINHMRTITTLMQLPTAPEKFQGDFSETARYYINLAAGAFEEKTTQAKYYANVDLLRRFAIFKCSFLNSKEQFVEHVKRVIEAKYNIRIQSDMKGDNFISGIVKEKFKTWDKGLTRKLWDTKHALFNARCTVNNKASKLGDEEGIEFLTRRVVMVFANISVSGVFSIRADIPDGSFSKPKSGDGNVKAVKDEESDHDSASVDDLFRDKTTSKKSKHSQGNPTKNTRSGKAGLKIPAHKKSVKVKHAKKKSSSPPFDIVKVSTYDMQVMSNRMRNKLRVAKGGYLSKTGETEAMEEAKKFRAMIKMYERECINDDKEVKKGLLTNEDRKTDSLVLKECKEIYISFDPDGSLMKEDDLDEDDTDCSAMKEETASNEDLQTFISDCQDATDAARKREADREAAKAAKAAEKKEEDNAKGEAAKAAKTEAAKTAKGEAAKAAKKAKKDAKSGEKRKADGTDEEADETHEIGQIVSVMIDSRGKVFYECFWDGYTHSENTFEPLSNLGPFEAEGKRLIEKVEKYTRAPLIEGDDTRVIKGKLMYSMVREGDDDLIVWETKELVMKANPNSDIIEWIKDEEVGFMEEKKAKRKRKKPRKTIKPKKKQKVSTETEDKMERKKSGDAGILGQIAKEKADEEDGFKAILEKADWRSVTYDEKSEPIMLQDTSMFYVCARAKPGTAQCCHAVCQECFNKATTTNGRRSRGRSVVTKSPNTLKHKQCCHSLHDLEPESAPWWCDPGRKRDGLFSKNWMARNKGCVGCKRMFVWKAKKDWKVSKLDDDVRAMYQKLHDGTLQASFESNGNVQGCRLTMD